MRARKKLLKFLKDETGIIMLLWGLTLPMMMGGVGLGVEASNWLQIKRNLQSSADAAAISAAFSITAGSDLSNVAGTEMNRNGYGSANGVSITVNHPPSSGAYASNGNAVEVIATKTEARALSATLMAGNPTIYARSVALRQPTGTACVLALDTINNDVLETSGSAVVNMSSCVLASNSISPHSVNITGNASLTVDSIYSAGGIDISNNSTVNNSHPNTSYGAAVTDPYAGMNVPSFSGCDHNNYSLNAGQSATLDPGVYCGGFNLNSSSTVTLNPGTYIIDRGDFNINGGATLTGSGVTIILTDSSGSNPGEVTINGNASVTLSAPTTGTYSGMLFFQDRDNSNNSNNHFNGGAAINLTGALYFPTEDVHFNGGADVGGSCIQIIAEQVNFNGDVNLSSNCTGTGVQNVALGSSVKIVE